ncbi:MAG TPA: SGNH/GDSL hydrolase family protein [Candidatus Sulfotelmatobacter sp.]
MVILITVEAARRYPVFSYFIRAHETKAMKLTPRNALFIAILCASFAALGNAKSHPVASAWVGSWAASQQLPEPNNALDPNDLRDATLRQIVHLSVGGKTLRVHLSNAFGTTTLRFSSVHIAHPLSTSGSKIDLATDKALSFAGAGDVVIPPGAEYISDALDYPVAALSDLAISLHLDVPPDRQTGHPGSRATSYLARGDVVAASDLPDAKRAEHWYWIAGVDVNAEKNSRAIVVLGDSITDGHGATTNGNDRWPDVLARRLQADPKLRTLGVLNQGIGGNHLLTDGLGPNALARIDRDILAQTGVRYLIVLEGVNDLGKLAREGEVPRGDHDALVQQMIGVYAQIVARAHTHGIMVIGAPILPYVGSDYYHPAPANEADRLAVNKWIRDPGHFDAVIDFDRLTADPTRPDRLLPAYDSGDHLHPSAVGYRAMGDAVPLVLFGK